MLGFLVFEKIFINLGEECRNKILGNIFGVSDVSVSSVYVEDLSITFRLFGNGVFYQYVFIVGSGENRVLNERKIVDCEIFICNDGIEGVNNFIYRLVQCQDEYQVYRLMKEFL